MRYLLITLNLLFSSVLSGCGDKASANEERVEKDVLSSCLGFDSPSINIAIHSSLDDDAPIENASVQIISESQHQSLSEDAYYVATDDGLADSETGAYWSPLSLDSSFFTISIVATAEGFHTFVTKDIPFELKTTCGANNTVRYTAYLCPIGTACI